MTLPRTIAVSIGGILGSTRCESAPTASVAAATRITQGLASPRCLNAPSTSSVKPAGAETMPRKLPSWLAKMNTPSAAVKPTTTELDMKFTSEPNRRRPSASMMVPDISASVSASWM